MIRFDNFKSQYATLKSELDEAVHHVLDSGWFIMGKELEAFETEFAVFTGSRYAVGVASATDAIAFSFYPTKNVGEHNAVMAALNQATDDKKR